MAATQWRYVAFCETAVSLDGAALRHCQPTMFPPPTFEQSEQQWSAYAEVCVMAALSDPEGALPFVPHNVSAHRLFTERVLGEDQAALGVWSKLPLRVRRHNELAMRAMKHAIALNYEHCPAECSSAHGILCAVCTAPSLFRHANAGFLQANPQIFVMAMETNPMVLHYITEDHTLRTPGLAMGLLRILLDKLPDTPTQVMLGLRTLGRLISTAELLEVLRWIHENMHWNAVITPVDMFDMLGAGVLLI